MILRFLSLILFWGSVLALVPLLWMLARQLWEDWRHPDHEGGRLVGDLYATVARLEELVRQSQQAHARTREDRDHWRATARAKREG